ncbi:hypothetical protein, conserved in T. vivax [Trypanosoma vivax Y486]|uniref:Uncharacterized protein n=1 Tax=Trypanosoma vivax (strain Y486) TaxID=1055687 RepID=F9WLW4_TRYVY|nr:hypothetical protein, conserved in T. vivax [Trypanosoma vivax Y486]|eukprot:CCD18508.1 hypothetical protein, conserved in T. vivax [Trypanosoma vivax Y486]
MQIACARMPAAFSFLVTALTAAIRARSVAASVPVRSGARATRGDAPPRRGGAALPSDVPVQRALFSRRFLSQCLPAAVLSRDTHPLPSVWARCSRAVPLWRAQPLSAVTAGARLGRSLSARCLVDVSHVKILRRASFSACSVLRTRCRSASRGNCVLYSANAAGFVRRPVRRAGCSFPAPKLPFVLRMCFRCFFAERARARTTERWRIPASVGVRALCTDRPRARCDWRCVSTKHGTATGEGRPTPALRPSRGSGCDAGRCGVTSVLCVLPHVRRAAAVKVSRACAGFAWQTL